jgi:DNA-binding NarL/FixJ family response regulator
MSISSCAVNPAVVLMVDEHPLTRAALSEVLRLTMPDVDVLEASDPDEGLAVLRTRDDARLVFMELEFARADGHPAIARFRDMFPAAPIIIYTRCEDLPTLRRALAQGAAGVVPKTHSAALVRRAIEIVMEGGVYLPPPLALGLAREAVSAPPAAPASTAMSFQQARILELLEQGLPNKEIARKLGLAASTVRNQLSTVFRRLGVSNRTQAVIVARAVAKSTGEATP